MRTGGGAYLTMSKLAVQSRNVQKFDAVLIQHEHVVQLHLPDLSALANAEWGVH